MSEFIQQVGGVPVVMPFPDVVPALQTGVADCAITGTYTGNRAGWGEVTDSLFTLPIGTGVSFYGYSTRNWLELDPSLRDLIETEFTRFEKEALGPDQDADPDRHPLQHGPGRMHGWQARTHDPACAE